MPCVPSWSACWVRSPRSNSSWCRPWEVILLASRCSAALPSAGTSAQVTCGDGPRGLRQRPRRSTTCRRRARCWTAWTPTWCCGAHCGWEWKSEVPERPRSSLTRLRRVLGHAVAPARARSADPQRPPAATGGWATSPATRRPSRPARSRPRRRRHRRRPSANGFSRPKKGEERPRVSKRLDRQAHELSAGRLDDLRDRL